jgi:hypothetical protein
MSRQDRAKELSRKGNRTKEELYAGYMQWFGTPICRDFETLFGISMINKHDLIQIATAVSVAVNLPLDRPEKRVRKLLNGWFNLHYEIIRPILTRIAIVRPNGEACGPMRDRLLEYEATHPNGPFFIGAH